MRVRSACSGERARGSQIVGRCCAGSAASYSRFALLLVLLWSLRFAARRPAAQGIVLLPFYPALTLQRANALRAVLG
jgi:hypothetical protein